MYNMCMCMHIFSYFILFLLLFIIILPNVDIFRPCAVELFVYLSCGKVRHDFCILGFTLFCAFKVYIPTSLVLWTAFGSSFFLRCFFRLAVSVFLALIMCFSFSSIEGDGAISVGVGDQHRGSGSTLFYFFQFLVICVFSHVHFFTFTFKRLRFRV